MELMLLMEHIRSRLATTWLIVEASLNVQATVGVLLLPVMGARQVEDVHTSGKVASCRTNTANFRSDLVMFPSGLIKLISFFWMLCGHSRRQTKCVPSRLGSNHTPALPKPDVLVYPKSICCHYTIFVKLVGQCFICSHRCCQCATSW